MKFSKAIEYTADNVTIRFQPIDGVLPGFSHKVIIIRDGKAIAKDWLGSDFNVTEKNATYYYNKHILGEK